MTETIKPLGYNVLVEMEEVKDVSKGGIFMGDVERDQSVVDIGYVRAIGNIAFAGFAGCDPSTYPTNSIFHSMQPHQIWGINVGDKVEYHHLEGQTSRTKGYERFRVIPDSQIIIKVEEKADE